MLVQYIKTLSVKSESASVIMCHHEIVTLSRAMFELPDVKQANKFLMKRIHHMSLSIKEGTIIRFSGYSSKLRDTL